MFMWMHDDLGGEVTEDYHALRPSVDELLGGMVTAQPAVRR